MLISAKLFSSCSHFHQFPFNHDCWRNRNTRSHTQVAAIWCIFTPPVHREFLFIRVKYSRIYVQQKQMKPQNQIWFDKLLPLAKSWRTVKSVTTMAPWNMPFRTCFWMLWRNKNGQILVKFESLSTSFVHQIGPPWIVPFEVSQLGLLILFHSKISLNVCVDLTRLRIAMELFKVADDRRIF